MSDPKHTHDAPGDENEGDAASSSSESADGTSTRDLLDDETTDDEGKPLENPSGG